LASIASDGQRAPIVVVIVPPGDYEVIDGFRRLRALKRLQVEIVAAIEWPTSVVDALLELRHVHGASRSAASVEVGLLIAALVDAHGLSLAELAVRFGRSRTWVHNRLSLVRQLPEAVCRRVLAGELSGYIACKVVVPLARANSEWVEPFCQCIVEHGLTTRQAEVLYRGLTRIAAPETRRQILERPSRILDFDGEQAPSRRSKSGPDPLDVVEQLERWCHRAHGLLSLGKKILANGASEDTMDRLALAWRKNEESVTRFVHLLEEIALLERNQASTRRP
jgi:ParB/RepB/Spo0J family partition protein